MVSSSLILLPLLLAATQSGEAAKINSNGCDFSQFGALNAMNIFPNFECYPVRYAPTAEDIKAILMTHNKMRMKVAMGKEERGSPGPQPTAANMREMVWDMQLADLAQAWANQCSFSHDEYASRQTCKDSTIGQNLLIKDSADMFNGKKLNWPRAIHEWYIEVENHPGAAVQEFTSLMNGEATTGHYTQLAWAESNKIGCGATQFGNQVLFVCNYAAEGNVKPQAVYMSGQPASHCVSGPSTFYPGLCK
ncbi:scoloptoxin SSD976-like [Eriocheir sinensis]|uniref:scoloptoxin SSD976-like n=1 Tax=Eriocheir sinensis TaxID=95602 RepID=UPI0021C616EF|nr:scoloptoxin SSD976-like [Eriocheir sinensis]